MAEVKATGKNVVISQKLVRKVSSKVIIPNEVNAPTSDNTYFVDKEVITSVGEELPQNLVGKIPVCNEVAKNNPIAVVEVSGKAGDQTIERLIVIGYSGLVAYKEIEIAE